MPQTGRLEYDERIAAWRRFGLRIAAMQPAELPGHSGVYALWQDGECLYVGASQNIRRRWGGLIKSRNDIPKKGVEVQVWLCPPDELGRLEKSKIAELHPTLNGAG
jgi:excinuclease UvrABC nuclease subunit